MTSSSKLNQGRAIARKHSAIRRAYVRIMAAHLTDTPKRYMELIQEAGNILGKEMQIENKIRRDEKR